MSRGGGVDVAATIDVGSNSVLLLVVAVDDRGTARAIDEALATTRLGQGLVPGGMLDAASAARTMSAVVELAARARGAGVREPSAFATGAVRAAADGSAFAAVLGAAGGCPVEILSGEREAALAYAAIVHGLGLASPVLAVDVGGLTTELTLGDGGAILSSTSLPLGALALAERHRADPEGLRRWVVEVVAATDVARRATGTGAVLAASGGTPTALAALHHGLMRYEARRVHGTVLTAADVVRHGAAASGSTAIDPGRAAILPAGACILAGLMEATAARQVQVSDHGVRHAYLRERLRAAGREVSMRTLWA